MCASSQSSGTGECWQLKEREREREMEREREREKEQKQHMVWIKDVVSQTD